MKLGIESLLEDRKLLKYLKSKRVALLAHPASTNHKLTHTSDALSMAGVILSSSFGPQHGMRGDKQDNMIESDDFLDPELKIPVFSLYGKVRRPTRDMMETFDILLVDLQDLGCRIYTFITTVLYVMEECQKFGKEIWILDRPNPAGRPVEGFTLESGWESFVGAGPIPMRYGLTIGELSLWFKEFFKLDVNLKVVKMKGYSITKAPGLGWPQGELTWINPSPNAGNLNMARSYSGTVLIEGTNLSEGRGTTRALETVGAPDIDPKKILAYMGALAPQWLKGCILRDCFFEPTFHKHSKTLCRGIQIHADHTSYDHLRFKPFRLVTLMLKAIRNETPEYPIWRDFPYEYETSKLAFDVINGGPRLKKWIDDPEARIGDLEKSLKLDETQWSKQYRKYFLYK